MKPKIDIGNKNFFSPLKQILKTRGIKIKDLAEHLGRSHAYVSACLTNRKGECFSCFECYEVLKFLELPESDFTVVFPSPEKIENIWNSNLYIGIGNKEV